MSYFIESRTIKKKLEDSYKDGLISHEALITLKKWCDMIPQHTITHCKDCKYCAYDHEKKSWLCIRKPSEESLRDYDFCSKGRER